MHAALDMMILSRLNTKPREDEKTVSTHDVATSGSTDPVLATRGRGRGSSAPAVAAAAEIVSSSRS